MIKKFTIALFLCFPFVASAQYLENFTGQNGKGLVNAICPAGTTNINNCGSICTANAMDNTSTCTTVPPSFTGVDWTIGLGPSATYFTDPGGFGFENDFATSDFGVVSEQLQIDDPDNEICWLSPELNIASAGVVSIAIDVSQTGGLESSDYIRGDYSLNGGGFVTFETQTGAFAPTQLNASGLTGTTLRIRVCALTNGIGEQIFFDNVSVPQTGVTTGCNAPVISAQATQAGSCNNTNGTIKVTASGATPGYNVAWSGPSSGNPGGTEIPSSGGMYTISPLAPGTYTITVTDAASCTATTTASITMATALSLSTQVLNTTCSSVNDGEIDLAVSNGVSPYSYSWSNLPGAPDPQDQTGLAPGTYTVTVTDAAGCTATTSATVAVSTPSAYLETFSIAGKGILDGSTCSGSNGTTCTNSNFAGVNWSIYGFSTLSGVDANDYFKTIGGKLEHKDIDQDVCWESPEIDINPPGTGIAFSVDLAWNSFDREPSPDYIDVEYSINGGGWTRAPNAVGGSATHTIGYVSGGGNDINGSTTVSVTGLSGSTLRIRVCGLSNSEDETFTIDNVSVPGSNGVYCPCPTITFTATPTNTCSGSSNGQIAVTGVTGGTGPYMYSKDNGSTFQSGATFTGLTAGMYNVVVKDVNACVSAATQVTVGTFTAPTCSVTGPDFVCNNTANIEYSAPGGMSAYSWSVTANGSIPGSTTGSSVSVTSGNFLNTYTVTVTVTDANGCTSSCSKASSIFLQKPPADITANPNPICLGAILDLSITAAASSTVSWTGEGITNPSGNPMTTAVPTTSGPHVYSVMVTANPSGCTNTGTVNVTVNPLPAAPTCPANSSTCLTTPAYALTGASPGGGAYSGPGVSAGMFDPGAAGAGTHTITYTVTDGNGCTNTCTFEISVAASCTIDFSGKIKFSNNPTLGVKDATVSLTGSATGSDLTDVNGDFYISTSASSGNFTLTPTKTINKLNGVTTADVTAIQLHVVNTTPITDLYKQVAADVNKTNSISTLDASIINQSLLGNPAALAQFKTSWRFVPTSHTMAMPPWGFPEQRSYTGISSSQTGQDFFGIKTGDVVTTFANPANFGAGMPLVLTAADLLLEPGSEFAVDLSAGQLDDLTAFQFALNVDPNYLEVVSVEPAAGGIPLKVADHIGLFNRAGGEVRFAWWQTTGITVAEATPVVRLQLKVLQAGAKLSEVVRLDDLALPGYSYNSALAESAVQLRFSQTTGTNPLEPGATSFQLKNRPNPFNQSTTISFVLPEAAEAQLRIFDAGGRLIWERSKAYPAGYQEEAVQLDGVSGVLSYELVTPFGAVTKRMVRVGN